LKDCPQGKWSLNIIAGIGVGDKWEKRFTTEGTENAEEENDAPLDY
jgi:hypothetical protein